MRSIVSTATRLRRMRWTALALTVLAGWALCAIEKNRPEDFGAIWKPAYMHLAAVLDPLRSSTHQSMIFLHKIGRLWQTEDENQRMARELSRLRLETQMSNEQLGRLRRLSGLGQWEGPPEVQFLGADVVGQVVDKERAELIINRGASDGIRPRDPVVALGGLVGIVRSVSEHGAHIQTLIDRECAVGAVTTGNRLRGVVQGNGKDKPLEFLPANELQPIEIGTMVVTSGFENSVYPKGIVIGVIDSVRPNKYAILNGVIVPAVSFDSVEEVLLVIPRDRLWGRSDESTTQTLGRFTIRMPQAALAPGARSSIDGALTTGSLAEGQPTSITAVIAPTPVSKAKPAPNAERPSVNGPAPESKRMPDENEDASDGEPSAGEGEQPE